LYIAALAILSVWGLSCGDDDPKEAPRLEVSPEEIVLDSNGEGMLTITSNTLWSISTSSKWLALSTLSGVGNGQVVVMANDRSTSERSAIVTVKGENNSRQVVVTQLAAEKKKYYIYGDIANYPDQVPFQPGAWDAAAMRFSDTEGTHLPTIPDDVYFGLKTLIFDVSNVSGDFDLKVMNGWWSNTYYDHVKWVSGLNELQITETMANECAKGGEGHDLDLMLYSGTCTIKAVYYEE
jgi:hypothetical protein